MIIETSFLNSDHVVEKLRWFAPRNYTSVLALGAGRLGLEKQVFRDIYGNLPEMCAADWCDEDLAEVSRIPNVRGMKVNLNLTLPFLGKSWDVVTLFDVVEHVDNYRGIMLIREACEIARKGVLAFVPVQKAFLAAPEELEKMQEAAYQAGKVMAQHLSLWTPDMMESLGFTVLYDSTYHERRGTCKGIEGAMVCYKNMEV